MNWSQDKMTRGMFPGITDQRSRLLEVLYIVAFFGLGLFVAYESEYHLTHTMSLQGNNALWYLAVGLIAAMSIVAITRTVAFVKYLAATVAGLNFMILGVDLFKAQVLPDHRWLGVVAGLLCFYLSIKSFALSRADRIATRDKETETVVPG
jgi:cell division protein FtsW (lipid II flippase)